MSNSGDVDVWAVSFKHESCNFERYLAVLAPNEHCRLLQIKHQEQKARFVISRGVLRHLLADYLSVSPESIEFDSGMFGKPVVIGHELQFNVSHSGDCLLVAISRRAQIGVDVEVVRSRYNLSALARRCLAEREFGFWMELSEDLKETEFYRFWVAKEAFVKAVGRGVALGVARCRLRVPDLDRFVSVPDEFGEANDWRLVRLEVPKGYAAALVMPSIVAVVHCYVYRT